MTARKNQHNNEARRLHEAICFHDMDSSSKQVIKDILIEFNSFDK